MKIALWGMLLVLFSSVFATAAQTADLDVLLEDLSVSGDTLEEQTPLAPAVVVEAKKPSREPQYYYITYSQQEANAAAISASTAKAQEVLQKKLDILYYVPYHRYIAKVSEQDLLALQDDGYVVDYRLFREQPGRYRISDTGETLYYVYAFQEEDVPAITEALEQLQISVVDVNDYVLVIDLKDVKPLDDRLSHIIQIEGVEAVEPRPTYELFNDKTNVVVGTAEVRQRLGLYGEGQIIAIADTGLDTGKNDNSMHLDFQGRIVSLVDLAYDPTNVCQGLNNPDDKRGHGTHVAGSAVGNGRRSGSDPATHYYPLGSYAGAAPEAKLVFQAIGCDQSGIGSAIPVPPSTKLYLPAYQQGARVHSNSYGGLTDGGYYAGEKDDDSFVNQYKDMLLVFAAGNSNQPMSTTNNGKNVITVGGIQRDQPNTQIYSRGPTKDGRFKPDILTPAIDILSPTNEGIISTKSSVQQPYPIGCENWPQSPYYCGMAGTSMAAPNGAGSIALLREYLIKKRNIPNPSAALVKAVYLNGAEDIGQGVPNTNYGWGRANLSKSLPADSQAYYDLATYDIRTGLTTGAKRTFTLVAKLRKPLRITLVWTDKEGCKDNVPPCVPTAPKLVNDLDLVVIDPQNNQYNGNDITVPYNDQWDRRNNVERVEIQNPVAGMYTVEVRGYNIPFPSQDFALVATYDNALVEFTPALPAKLCMVNGNPC